MKMFDIWQEGYACTGEGGPASKIRSGIVADSFQAACDLCFSNDKTYNAEKLTLWACGLFDNETDAREFLG